MKSKKRISGNDHLLITVGNDEVPVERNISATFQDSISANNEMDIDYKRISIKVEHCVLRKARSNNKIVLNLSWIDYSNLRR